MIWRRMIRKSGGALMIRGESIDQMSEDGCRLGRYSSGSSFQTRCKAFPQGPESVYSPCESFHHLQMVSVRCELVWSNWSHEE